YMGGGFYLGTNPFAMLILYLLVTFFLAIIFLFDLRYYLVSDLILYLGTASVLILKLFLGFNLMNIIIGAGIGFLFFGIQYFLSRGKWLGSGDIFIGIFMGIILAWPNILVAIFISYIIGGILALVLLIFKLKKLSAKLPLGPFLTFSTWLVFLWGDKILNWYLDLAGIL
ncbi:A24 family peptidase, partial [bacterium]|nr:A24 family peptidase [bacterium]